MSDDDDDSAVRIQSLSKISLYRKPRASIDIDSTSDGSLLLALFLQTYTSALLIRGIFVETITCLFSAPIIYLIITMSFSPSAGDWNRETSKPKDYDPNSPIINTARILVIGDPEDDSNARLYDKNNWPEKATIVGIGTTKDQLKWGSLLHDNDNDNNNSPTVLLVTSKGTRELLAECLTTFASSILWVHIKSAGIEHCTSPTFAATPPSIAITNARGHFSSTLAEYGMLSCAYFAKKLPTLLKNHANKDWNRYSILEMRGSTLGIIGYGDIGRATGKLAKAYGMKVIALRRKRKESDKNVPICDATYYSDENANALNDVCAASDYLFVAAPLTEQTKHMIGEEQFNVMKPTAVLINVGRGAVLDEEALIAALQAGKIKGAALDVFTEEPLPIDSPLWAMTEKVLLSPHNMDKTDAFMHEATDFFLDENLPRFLRGLPLYNAVDRTAGY